MTKRRYLLLSGTALLAAVVLACIYHSTLIGWWRGEAKYKGRYTNSWRAELRIYDEVLSVGGLAHSRWGFFRIPSRGERWLGKMLPALFQREWLFHAPWKDGDPEAVPVLVELLQAPETNVRIMAANGLESIGTPAREAIPVLLIAMNDENGEVAQAARQALGAVDREVAAKHDLAYFRWRAD